MPDADELKTTIENQVTELKDKVLDAKTRLQLRKRIADNPWGAVAFGALAGVWVASHGRGHRKKGAVVGVLGALTLRVIRDAAMYQMTKIARGWFDAPATPTPFAH